MSINHGDHVSVYDKNGNFELKGRIVGIYGLSPDFFDVQPNKEFSMAKRLCGIPSARIRKHYVAPHMVDARPKHSMDEA